MACAACDVCFRRWGLLWEIDSIRWAYDSAVGCIAVQEVDEVITCSRGGALQIGGVREGRQIRVDQHRLWKETVKPAASAAKWSLLLLESLTLAHRRPPSRAFRCRCDSLAV